MSNQVAKQENNQEDNWREIQQNNFEDMPNF